MNPTTFALLLEAIDVDSWHATELKEASNDLAKDATVALATGRTGREFEELVRNCAWARHQSGELDSEGMTWS